MSTEHQQYSPENQLEVVRQYAASHNMEIVQEYSDHGRCSRRVGQHLLELTANVFQ
jgi:DNA invertase Pin-like site-specific DNA recombinase